MTKATAPYTFPGAFFDLQTEILKPLLHIYYKKWQRIWKLRPSRFCQHFQSKSLGDYVLRKGQFPCLVIFPSIKKFIFVAIFLDFLIFPSCLNVLKTLRT